MDLTFLGQYFKSWCLLIALTTGFFQLSASANETCIAFERDYPYSMQRYVLLKVKSAFI